MRKVMLLGLVLVVSVPFASATDSSVEEQLRKTYVGTQRMLRHFYDSDALKFDSNGNPRNTGKEGPWTLLGGVIIDRLQLKPGKLELQGRRRMLAFDTSKFDASNKVLLNFVLKETFWIEVQSQDGPDRGAQLSAALAQVFIPDGDLSSVVPDYWRDYVARFTGRQTQGKPCEGPQANVAGSTPQPAPAIRVSTGVADGLKTHDVAPKYPMLARRNWIQGDLVLRAVIEKNGDLGGICIIQALGAGLDESAVTAVRQWKYRPYIFNGEPVDVVTAIKVRYFIR
jgi:TonB family protein